MKHRFERCIVLAAGVLLAGSANAGIVNPQSVLAVAAEEGLSGSITGAADVRKGNTDKLLFSLAPVARYRAADHLFITYGSGEYDSTADIGKVFAHGRYRYIVLPWLTGEIFAQGEHDQRRQLDLRTLIGVGPLFQLFDRADLRFALGVAYMLEYEDVSGEVPDPGVQSRISSYLTGSYELKDNLQLVETVYAQPRIDDFDELDIRLLNETSLVITISEQLAFTSSFSYAYDTDPGPDGDGDGLARYDLALKSALTYQF